jgi:hypothetical protein
MRRALRYVLAKAHHKSGSGLLFLRFRKLSIIPEHLSRNYLAYGIDVR